MGTGRGHVHVLYRHESSPDAAEQSSPISMDVPSWHRLGVLSRGTVCRSHRFSGGIMGCRATPKRCIGNPDAACHHDCGVLQSAFSGCRVDTHAWMAERSGSWPRARQSGTRVVVHHEGCCGHNYRAAHCDGVGHPAAFDDRAYHRRGPKPTWTRIVGGFGCRT